MIKTDDATLVGAHVFTRSGLGAAPFRFLKMFEKTYQAHPDAPRQPGGSCAHCGTAITIHCEIQSADGRKFVVGSTCVEKTGDAGLIRAFRQSPAVRAKARAARAAKDARVCAEWAALISDPLNRAKLEAVTFTHPYSGKPTNRLAALESAWGFCGASGRNRYLKMLKNLCSNLETA